MRAGKLERPPYVHNWARYNFRDVAKTTRSMVAFAKGVPQITYAAGAPLIRDRIILGLDEETAVKAALSGGHKKSRPYVADFVRAFFAYDAERKFAGLPSFDQFVEPYRVSRSIRIPVKPLVVILEDGVLKPIFVVGWATMPLDDYQRRLLMTVIEDAVFSLTDFQRSPGEFISFPKIDGAREPLVWGRGDYELLSSDEMSFQMDVYLQSLEAAKAHLSRDLRSEDGDAKSTVPVSVLGTPQQEELF